MKENEKKEIHHSEIINHEFSLYHYHQQHLEENAQVYKNVEVETKKEEK